MEVLGIVTRATLAGEILMWDGIVRKMTLNCEIWSWSECYLVEVTVFGIITKDTLLMCSARMEHMEKFSCICVFGTNNAEIGFV